MRSPITLEPPEWAPPEPCPVKIEESLITWIRDYIAHWTWTAMAEELLVTAELGRSQLSCEEPDQETVMFHFAEVRW